MSVLRYPGGKSKALKFILPYIPVDIEILYSPFFGGGSVELELSKKNKELKIIANDGFTPLITFWNCVKNNKDIMVNELTSTHKSNIINKNKFMEFRRELENGTELDIATKFFIINRCSFSGCTMSGGYSNEAATKRFTSNSIEKIKTLDLQNFSFSNLDFTTFLDSISNINSPKFYIYADPPYYIKCNTLYGNKGDLHQTFDHVLFHEKISRLDNWIISYNNCEFIKNLYTNYQIIELDWSYSMNNQNNSTCKELLILSNKIT